MPGSFEPLPFDALDLPPDDVERHFAEARRSGMHRWLWPGVDPGGFDACRRAIGAAVRAVLQAGPADGHGLASGSRPVLAPPGSDARTLGIAAFTAGVGPLLGRWLEDGRLDAPPDVAAILDLHLRHGRRRAERMTRALGRAVAVLHDAGCTVTVLKGMHTGAVYYPEPGARPCADVDLAVPRDAYDRGAAALAEAGYIPGSGYPEPPKSNWTPPGMDGRLASLELAHAEAPFEVELHGGLDRDFPGVAVVRLGDPDPDTVPLPDAVGAPGARALDVERTFVMASLHIASEILHLQLLQPLELCLILEREKRRMNWDIVLETLERSGGTRFVYPALALAESLRPNAIPAAVLDRAKATTPRPMRRHVDALDPATAMDLRARAVRDFLLWADGPVEWLRALFRFLLPVDARTARESLARIYRRRLLRLIRAPRD